MTNFPQSVKSCSSTVWPQTPGDGTGCDNMTAVIVKFNKSLKSLKDEASPENGVETSEECSEPASKKLRLDSEVSERV